MKPRYCFEVNTTIGGHYCTVYVDDDDNEATDPMMPRESIPLVFEHQGRVYYLDVPDIPDVDDIWAMVELYDDIHGTDWWSVLDESMILGLGLDEYSDAIPVDRPEELEE